jgi:multidrug efflux pump subunit AcrB
MNPIVFALRRPVTVMMLVLALGIGGVYNLVRMPKDIFPQLNQPVLYVVHSWGGMDPKQIEGLITNLYEIYFQYVNGIEHIESRSVQSETILKIYFQPGIDMPTATAETVSYANRALASMPVGVLPPFILRLDAGSQPVGYLVLSSEGRSIAQMQDMAMFRVRPIFAGVPGLMSPPPFGGNMRTIVIDVDPDRLRSYDLSPQDVVEALDRGNYASPSGNVTIKDQSVLVPSNTMVIDPLELRNIPLKLGQNVYIRDVGTVTDSTDIPTGYALVNGRKSVYLPVVKRADASTLDVVNAVKAGMARFQAAVPEDVKISYEFDESPIVYRAIDSVGMEGALGAGLTGLMVLLFLRDIRSVVVVVLNIPLALLGAVVVLGLTGNTVNIMTLGGLALAIGILVDEATVEVENIHTQMEHTPSLSRAVRNGNMETAVPRLLALICILSVFIPSLIMEGAVRALFVPLSLAVGASMITSYLLSSTFVPVLSVWLLKPLPEGHGTSDRPSLFSRLQDAFERALTWVVAHRSVVVAGYLVVTLGFVVLVAPRLGRELFPRVNSGQMQMRVRPPAGTEFKLTTQVAERTIDVIAEVVGKDNVEITMGYVGATPPMFVINAAYLWSRGPEDAMLRVGLKEGSKIDIFELQEKLRVALPEKVGPWFRRELLRLGVPEDQAEQRSKSIVFAFEPGDLISATMSLGSPAPIEIVVSGRDLTETGAFMEQIRGEVAKISAIRDVQLQQTLHYPTIQVAIDRERAGLSGVTAHDIGDSLIAATYSSRYTARNYWRDDVGGISYQVQVQVPGPKMTEANDVALVPITRAGEGPVMGPRMAAINPNTNPPQPLLVRDVARVMRGEMPGEIDRYNMRRYLSLTANVEGEDLGRVVDEIDRALARVGKPPRGIEVDLRGQVKPMNQMFRSLEIGLAVAVIVILITLTAYFQSPRLALTAVASVPAVLAGVVLALWITRTTLNIQSFMGAIMAVGVAVSNAIMLVSFGDRHRLEDGMPAAQAAIVAAKGRLRPIIMTGCAMISGMVPMSLALEAGSEQNAPLGRAVMGGMAVGTIAALFILPAVFTLLMAKVSTDSASLDPDDPASRHYHEDGAPAGGHHAANGNGHDPDGHPQPEPAAHDQHRAEA